MLLLAYISLVKLVLFFVINFKWKPVMTNWIKFLKAGFYGLGFWC